MEGSFGYVALFMLMEINHDWFTGDGHPNAPKKAGVMLQPAGRHGKRGLHKQEYIHRFALDLA